MQENGFIENKKILDEFHRETNFFDLNSEQASLLGLISNMEVSGLVGVIGSYGEGKSTFLNQLKIFPIAKWFEFDAWKYPERSNLWENFILEIARQSNQEEFDNAIRQIDGRKNEAKKTLINTIGELPLLGVIKNFTYFLTTTPARRTFELQNILIEMLDSVKENNIYIIIEDIDRSGDSGVYFLETLNHFLKTIDSNKKVIGIIPIGTESYEKHDLQSSYTKSIDYFYEFSLRDINLLKFVEATFDGEITQNKYHKGQITTFLESLFREFPGQMNMRKLKMILRNANAKYISLYDKHGEGIDWRLAIVFEVAKHIKNQEGQTCLAVWRKYLHVGGFQAEPLLSLIRCVAEEGKHVQSKGIYHNPPYDSIYKSEYANGVSEQKLIGFESRLPIKFRNVLYKESDIKDSVFYHAHSFPSEGDKNYFSIITDYLY